MPPNLDATVRERWWEPLVSSLERIEQGKQKDKKGKGVQGEDEGLEGLEIMGELEVLMERLRLLGAAEGFRAISDHADETKDLEGKGKGVIREVAG